MHLKKRLLLGSAFLALLALPLQTYAANLTLSADGTWASAGTHTSNPLTDVTSASAGDNVDITSNGKTLTITNASGTENDGSPNFGGFRAFRLGNVTDSGAGVAGNLNVTSALGSTYMSGEIASVNLAGNATFISNTVRGIYMRVSGVGGMTLGGNLTIDNPTGVGSNAFPVLVEVDHNLVVNGTTSITGEASFNPPSALLLAADATFGGGVILHKGGAMGLLGPAITVTGNIIGDNTFSGVVVGYAINTPGGMSGPTNAVFKGTVGTAASKILIIYVGNSAGPTTLNFQKEVAAGVILMGESVATPWGQPYAGGTNTVTFGGGTSGFTITGDLKVAANNIDTNNIIINGTGGNTFTAANDWGASGGVALSKVTLNGGAGGLTTHGVLNATTVEIGTGTTLSAGGNITGDVTATTDGEGFINFSNTSTLTGKLGTALKQLKGLTLSGSGKTLTITGNTFAADTNTIGGNTINITGGTFTLGANQTLDVDITGATTSGSVTSSGIATTSAASKLVVRYNAGGAAIANGQQFKIIDGAGGGSVATLANGNLTLIGGANVGLSFTQAVNGDDLILIAGHSGPIISPSTANGIATNTALNNLPSGNPELDAIKGRLGTATTSAEMDSILETAAPTVNGSTLSVISSNAQVRAVEDVRISAIREGYVRTGMASGFSMNGVSLWLQGYGNSAKQSTRKDTKGYDANTAGVVIGMDSINALKDSVLGIAFNYGRTGADSKNLTTTSTDIDSYGINFYGNFDLGSKTFVNAHLSYAYNDIENERHNAGGPGVTASSTYHSDQYSTKLALGHDYTCVRCGAVVTPTASASYTYLKTGGYTETGAGGANRIVRGDNSNVLDLGVNVDAIWTLKNNSGSTLKPGVHAGYSYEAITANVESTSSFAGGGASFKTTAAPPARNTLSLGTGLTYTSPANVDVSANYNYEHKSDYAEHSGVVRTTLKF